MFKGKMIVKLDENKINTILSDNISSVPEAFIKLNEWAIPHWDFIKTARIYGAVQVSKKTAEYIIGRIAKILPHEKKNIMMMWLNYGWSVNYSLKTDECLINLDEVTYKEI